MITIIITNSPLPLLSLIFCRQVFLSVLIVAIVEQYMLPLVQNSVRPMNSLNVISIGERVLKLSIPNLYGNHWLMRNNFVRTTKEKNNNNKAGTASVFAVSLVRCLFFFCSVASRFLCILSFVLEHSCWDHSIWWQTLLQGLVVSLVFVFSKLRIWTWDEPLF